MSDNRKSFTPMDMLTSGGNGDVGCATPFGYVTARYQGGEIVSVTVDEDRFVPESGQGAEPSGWLNKRGEILSADQKARLIESGGIVAASIRTNFTIPLYTHPQPAVPDKKPLPDLFMASYHEAIGWNACVDAMLARSPQPPKEGSGDGWVKCSERLPTKADSDALGFVWTFNEFLGITALDRHAFTEPPFYTHWKPTGLKRPQPPQEDE